MRILCAPDKFAGAASARQIAQAMALGVADAGHRATLLPIADGGEGSQAVLPLTDCRSVPCHGPWGQASVARVGLLPAEANGLRTAFIESAQACGPPRRVPGQPPWASSAGLGEVLLATLKRADRVVIGLGGSATVDLGVGLAAALGAVWRQERAQTKVSLPEDLPGHGRVVAWCDVDAPLLAGPETGPNGLVSGRDFWHRSTSRTSPSG